MRGRHRAGRRTGPRTATVHAERYFGTVVHTRPTLLLFALLFSVSCTDAPDHPAPEPIDPQRVQDQDDMTWDDYRPIPGVNWADPSLEPERGFRIALVAMDFPDQPFVITQPRGSDPFGNPQVDPIARDDVPAFYRDFWIEPNAFNHGHTINGYWMEQSRGAFGITGIDAYGPYRMPQPLWSYGLNEWGQNESTPDGSRAESRMEPHVDSLWREDAGDVRDDYDAVLRIYAGYDETGVWQEFGEMKFETRDDIPPEWGNPNPEMPRWIPTRYVEWTSWLAGAQQWGLSSMRQGENSGTITHELGHFAFGIPDLNNNPYVEPYRRVAAGPWDMMDRGSFNGPGGPHSRWVVPPSQGASMPAGLMLKNRLENEFLSDDDVLALSRVSLSQDGVAVARVTARAVDPVEGAYAGVTVRLDGFEPGDRREPSDPALDPLSPGLTPYDFYSIEVVQRIGYDSFTPDDGVLLALNRDALRGNNGGPNAFNSFIWVVDAHPEDMNAVDFVRSNGERVMRTVADYRQLNDALFHAGLGSGSRFEWVDEANRLHFYVVDLESDERGIRTYTVAVRALDGGGERERNVVLAGPTDASGVTAHAPFVVTVSNTGTGSPTEQLDYDVVRVTATVDGRGWTARLLNGLSAIRAGGSETTEVYLTPEAGADREAVVTVRATSESDPAATATVSWTVRR